MTVGTELVPGPEAVDVTPLKDGGIMKEVKVAGKGTEYPLPGDKVFVHYVGKLLDGSKFDSSRDRNEQFSFNINAQEVIKGWDIGVASMTVGEVATFFIKSEYGYGSAGSPPKIPGDATLVFEIELFSFQGEDVSKEKDGSIIKRTRTAGEGYDQPNDGSQVEIQIRGVANRKVFDERKVEFEVGEGLDKDIPRGIELALEKMKKNEVAQITLKPSSGFGVAGNISKGVPPDTTLTYDVTLIKFEKAKESWQLDAAQKVDQAQIFKEKGTKHFKDGKYEIASTRYQKVIEFLEHEITLKGEAEAERKNILQAGRLNLALCYLKMSKWIKAREVCDKAIEEKEDTAKAWFRRGEAQLALNDCDAAKADFEKCFELDPENKAAKNKIAICVQKIKNQKDKEKKTFANMFDKFAAIDQKREDMEKQRRPDAMNNIDQWSSGGDSGISTDPNNIKVGGDINMSMDINQAIKEDMDINQEVKDGED